MKKDKGFLHNGEKSSEVSYAFLDQFRSDIIDCLQSGWSYTAIYNMFLESGIKNISASIVRNYVYKLKFGLSYSQFLNLPLTERKKMSDQWDSMHGIERDVDPYAGVISTSAIKTNNNEAHNNDKPDNGDKSTMVDKRVSKQVSKKTNTAKDIKQDLQDTQLSLQAEIQTTCANTISNEIVGDDAQLNSTNVNSMPSKNDDDTHIFVDAPNSKNILDISFDAYDNDTGSEIKTNMHNSTLINANAYISGNDSNDENIEEKTSEPYTNVEDYISDYRYNQKYNSVGYSDEIMMYNDSDDYEDTDSTCRSSNQVKWDSEEIPELELEYPDGMVEVTSDTKTYLRRHSDGLFEILRFKQDSPYHISAKGKQFTATVADPVPFLIDLSDSKVIDDENDEDLNLWSKSWIFKKDNNALFRIDEEDIYSGRVAISAI